MYNKRNKSFGWASSITEISPGVGLLFIDHSETKLSCVCVCVCVCACVRACVRACLWKVYGCGGGLVLAVVCQPVLDTGYGRYFV